MWDTPFDESMLSLEQGVVIHCPEEYLAEELFEIFKRNGVGTNWSSQELQDTKWDRHREETAYFVRRKVLLFGPKEHAEHQGYRYISYEKCTFFGDTTSDFEIESEDGLRNLLGIRGD